jgi:hypothetical protein
MIRSSLVALLLVAGLAVASRAAVDARPAAQQTPVSTVQIRHPKPVNFNGTVINQTSTFLTVQSSDPNHLNEVRTFTFTKDLQPRMQKILDHGGYQHGDKVVVKCLPGSRIALSIHGKPSKPV